MSTQDVKRARIIATILGAAVVITLCSLIYAQFQASRAERLELQIDSLRLELESIRSSRKPVDR
ncbi:MAG: hypothetical protein ABJH04_07025 [Cyclobacteriaceae bacterium]